ncbi:MAG: DUF805 domain-containing protein [Lachnospiraceae bacterium]|nr:DUF805 domain-containing protein [Lachnospiraceae bacterium]
MRPFNWKVKRISRLYFWIAWFISNLIGFGIVFLILGESSNYDSEQIEMLLMIVCIIYVVYEFLLISKRYHDAGKSTAFCVLSMLLMPFAIGSILIMWICAKKSDQDNEWGPNEERILYEQDREYYGR